MSVTVETVETVESANKRCEQEVQAEGVNIRYEQVVCSGVNRGVNRWSEQVAQGSSTPPGHSATSLTTSCVRGCLGSRHAYIAKASIQHTHVPGVHANAETPKHLSCDDARSLARRACSHAAPLALTSRAATPANKVGDSPVGLPIGANNEPLRLGERGEVGCNGRP